MSLVPLQEPPGSRCFVCATANPSGLRIPFAYDDSTGAVQAEVAFGDLHGGAPTYVHIGLTLAVLNEAMAWSVVATTERFAVTTATDATFARPVRIGPRYRFLGRVDTVAGPRVQASATVVDADGVECARASATFHMISTRVADRLRARVGGQSRR
jgi:hypothetical protein